MKKYTAIIVDDENNSRELLQLAIKEFCPYLEILAEAENIPQAVKAIHQFQPQLVFLDLEMPGYLGLQLFEFFEEINFKVIITTAYGKQYHEEIYRRNLPILLKPIRIDELVKTVNRLTDSL